MTMPRSKVEQKRVYNGTNDENMNRNNKVDNDDDGVASVGTDASSHSSSSSSSSSNSNSSSSTTTSSSSSNVSNEELTKEKPNASAATKRKNENTLTDIKKKTNKNTNSMNNNDYKKQLNGNQLKSDEGPGPAPIPSSGTSTTGRRGRGRGRTLGAEWSIFTNEPDARQQKKGTCQHCHKVVKHHGLVTLIRRHLNKCPNLDEDDAAAAFLNHATSMDRVPNVIRTTTTTSQNGRINDGSNSKKRKNGSISDDDNPMSFHPTTNRTGIGRTRGRKLATEWTLFTTDPNPNKSHKSLCQHCSTMIHHRNSVQYVRKHLIECIQYEPPSDPSSNFKKRKLAAEKDSDNRSGNDE